MTMAFDTELAKYSFDATGVAVIRQAIDEADLDEALQLIRGNWQGYPIWKFPVLHLGRVFWRFMTHPFLLELSDAFLGEHFRMDHAFGVSGKGAPAQMHGGPQSSQYSCFYLPLPNSQRKGIAGQLNFGFVLQGQSPSTGGFCYIPGSHKVVDPRPGAQVLRQIYKNNFNHHSVVVPTLSPGDIILFTEGLVHGDTKWKSSADEVRLSIYYKMTTGWMCWRDPAENSKYLKYAETELEKNLLEPPWTGRYSEDNHSMGFDNDRRKPTVAAK